jgi:hypothetical protein
MERRKVVSICSIGILEVFPQDTVMAVMYIVHGTIFFHVSSLFVS